MKSNILLIEGKRTDIPSFVFGLIKKGYKVDSSPNGSSAVLYLMEKKTDLVIVNAASMRTTGIRICQSVKRQSPKTPIILITEQSIISPDKSSADIILTLPFTLQKLINRIRPLLPGEQKNIINAGGLQLDIDNRLVRFNGRQIRLTPRLAVLLKALMERPGEVIEREELFRLVWDTAYTADMRTLDVHISWLRQKIEANPRLPQFIKTVRGTGYRLDI